MCIDIIDQATFEILLLPVYIGNVDGGVKEQLNQMILKYDENLNGVLLSYSNLKYSEKVGSMYNESPRINFHIKATVFIS